MTLSASARAFLQRFDVAVTARREITSILDDCYEYALPLRNRTAATGRLRRMERVYDSTAIEALQSFASQMLNDIWPSNMRPFDLVAGPEVPDDRREQLDRALAEVADDLIETANNSEFPAAAHEMLCDFGIGTGIMLVEEGDAVLPVRHECVPLSEAILGVGPRGAIEAMWRVLRPRLIDIPRTWPDAVLPEALKARIAQDTAGAEQAQVVEGVERDWSERGEEAWKFRTVLVEPEGVELAETTWRGEGSCPVLWPSYMRVAGEVIGRGPVQIALPDIATLNETKYLILANADLAVTGLWQADDDGVINLDNVTIAPGTVIARMPGSKGLESIVPASRFDVAQLVVGDLQAAIRSALFVNDLGPLDQTPRSATEIMQRTADRARRLSGPAGRLLTEFLFPYVRRLSFLRQRQLGQKLPRFDGKQVRIVPRGPLTLAQKEEQVLRFNRFAEIVQLRFGPQIANLTIDAEKSAGWLARTIGVQPDLVRTEVERKHLVQQIAAVAEQAASAGMDIGAMAGAR